MAVDYQLDIIKNGGVLAWNTWRDDNPTIKPDLSGADLRDIDFTSDPAFNGDTEVNFQSTNLRGTDFSESMLIGAKFDDADMFQSVFISANVSYASAKRTNLQEANFYRAVIENTDFAHAKLNRAHFACASLSRSIFSHSDLREADLREATLVETIFKNDTDLTSAWIYGVSAWSLKADTTIKQDDLVISEIHTPRITVDNLEVAQFVYLLLDNPKIRDVIDTVGKKGVLILGRFSRERKIILDAIRDKLRLYDYVPMLFDFEEPEMKNLTETISTLAHLSRFVIADITDAKSIPQEMQEIVPRNPSLPIKPIILSSQYEYGMFKAFRDYPWVLQPFRYDDIDMLLELLGEEVITKAEDTSKEIIERRNLYEEEMRREAAKEKHEAEDSVT